MTRIKGSGWGGGTIYYQKCPFCNKKKVMYDPIDDYSPHPFKCTSCKARFQNDKLERLKYVSQIHITNKG